MGNSGRRPACPIWGLRATQKHVWTPEDSGAVHLTPGPGTLPGGRRVGRRSLQSRHCGWGPPIPLVRTGVPSRVWGRGPGPGDPAPPVSTCCLFFPDSQGDSDLWFPGGHSALRPGPRGGQHSQKVKVASAALRRPCLGLGTLTAPGSAAPAVGATSGFRRETPRPEGRRPVPASWPSAPGAGPAARGGAPGTGRSPLCPRRAAGPVCGGRGQPPRGPGGAFLPSRSSPAGQAGRPRQSQGQRHFQVRGQWGDATEGPASCRIQRDPLSPLEGGCCSRPRNVAAGWASGRGRAPRLPIPSTSPLDSPSGRTVGPWAGGGSTHWPRLLTRAWPLRRAACAGRVSSGGVRASPEGLCPLSPG